MLLCEQQEKERWKEADTYTASTRLWLLHVIYHSLETYQNRRCRIGNQFSRHVRLRAYLRWSHKLTSPKSPSKIVEWKHNLMHMCTTFSASSLFHHVLNSAWSGSTPYHNALSNNISSDCSSYYIDGLMHSMHSVFVESLNLSQVQDSNTRIYTIHYYIAEINPVLLHWWGVYAILLLHWGIRCLITLLSSTQQ